MIRSFNIQDFVEKDVVPFGNGSIVYTPKKWLGRKVFVLLEEKPLDIMGGAMESLKQHLGAVEGIYLFGSFARNEQSGDSDIDLLVISGRKLALKKEGRFDFLAMTKKEFLESLKSDKTLFLHNILGEAKPILNESLLGELLKAERKPDYDAMLESTVGAFRNIHLLLDACKKQGLEYLDSGAIIYSLMLRIRGLVSAQCLERKKAYSHKMLVGILEGNGFNRKTINDFIAVYRAERDNKKISAKISLSDAERLFEAAKLEFVKTEMLVKA